MNSARYPKPRERRVEPTSGAARTEGAGKGWYVRSSGSPEIEDANGSGNKSRGGEYFLQRDCTILVIREILLFDEQMNLRDDSR